MRAAVELLIEVAITLALFGAWRLYRRFQATDKLIRHVLTVPDPGPLAAVVSAPAYLLRPDAAEKTVIWACGCTIAYLNDGESLFASCGTHRRHPDWQAWEAQMAQEGQA